MMKFKCRWSKLLLILTLFVPYNVYASLEITKIPDKGYCADEGCQKPISTAAATLSYKSIHPNVLSCKYGSHIAIYSRSDDRKLFPLVVIDGKRGFFPPHLFRVLKVKVKTEEVNVPVQFIINEENTIVIKALSNKTSLLSSEALNVTSSTGSNVSNTSFHETFSIPDIPLEDQAYKGSLFAHASAAEASESNASEYAPGHPPEFPQIGVGATGVPNSSVKAAGDDSSVVENKNVEAEVDKNDESQVAKNEEGSKMNQKEPDGESLAEKAETTSAGIEDEDDEDDEGLTVENEYSDDFQSPHASTIQSSFNDKTEAVPSVSVTESVHPSTDSEGSVESRTPSPMPSTSLPPVSSSKPPIPPGFQSSKTELPDVPASDVTRDDRKQEETTESEPPKISEGTVTQSESSTHKTSGNLSEPNVEANQTSSGPEESNSDAGSDRFVGSETLNQTDQSRTGDKVGPSVSSPEQPWSSIKANSTEGIDPSYNHSSEAAPDHSKEAVTGDTSPQQHSVAQPPEPTEQTQQSSPIAVTISSSHETAPLGSPSPQVTPATQQDTLHKHRHDFYRGPLNQQSLQSVQPGVGQLPTHLPSQPVHSPAAHTPQPVHPLGGHPPSQPVHSPAAHTPQPVHPQAGHPPSQPVHSPAAHTPQPVHPLAGHPPSQPVHSPAAHTPQPVHPLAGHPPSQPVDPQAAYPPSQTSDSQVPPSPHQPGDSQTPQPMQTSQPVDYASQQYAGQSSHWHQNHLQEQLLGGRPFSRDLPAQPEAGQGSKEPVAPSPDSSLTSESGTALKDDTTAESINLEESYKAPEQPSLLPENSPQPLIPEDSYKAPEQPEVLSENAESSSSWWDQVFSLFSSSESPTSSPLPDAPVPVVPPESAHTYLPQQDVPQSADVITCPDGSLGPDCPQESFLPFQVDDLFAGLGVESVMTRIIAAGITLLLCLIAYFFFENRRMDGSLIARINALERELMVLSKENILLKEECASNIGEGQLEVFLKELEDAKAARADLEEQVATLERDLDEAAEANIELNHMLAQTLENPKGSADVLASVERLQAQLDGQRDTIGNMTRSLSSKSAEIEALKVQITEYRETISGLEAEVASLNETVANLRREKEDANIVHVEKLQDVQNQLAEALANKVLEESRLGSELSSVKLSLKKTRQIVVAKESEIEALRESVRELKSGEVSEEKLTKLFDAVKLHAQVDQLTRERNELEDSLRGEGDARRRLENHVRVIEEEVNKLRVSYEEAQKDKTEAQTRLSVLSNYFKEKEAQLKKELDLQEILLAQQRGDENSVLRQVQSLHEEVETYRSQNESLKREIVDQERDLKGQIATLEKKSHDNWVSARQAERKLEESRQEASQLRNRLTLVEKNLSSSGEAGGVEANGEGGVVSPVMGLPGMGPMGALMGPMGPMIPPPPPPINLDTSGGLPPFMFPPLSPGSLPPRHPHFIPPLPPPPLLAGDRRPPPLGRMSSPPPVPPPPGHFSPPPPHFDRLDRPSQSPSPTYHRSPAGGERQGFRPLTKPNPRKPTDYRGSNPSSGQSNESVEKARTNEHV